MHDFGDVAKIYSKVGFLTPKPELNLATQRSLDMCQPTRNMAGGAGIFTMGGFCRKKKGGELSWTHTVFIYFFQIHELDKVPSLFPERKEWENRVRVRDLSGLDFSPRRSTFSRGNPPCLTVSPSPLISATGNLELLVFRTFFIHLCNFPLLQPLPLRTPFPPTCFTDRNRKKNTS